MVNVFGYSRNIIALIIVLAVLIGIVTFFMFPIASDAIEWVIGALGGFE